MVKTLLALSLIYLLNISRKMLDIILLHFTVDKDFIYVFTALHCTGTQLYSLVL